MMNYYKNCLILSEQSNIQIGALDNRPFYEFQYLLNIKGELLEKQQSSNSEDADNSSMSSMQRQMRQNMKSMQSSIKMPKL